MKAVGEKEAEEREVGDNSAFMTKLTETCRLFTNHLLTASATAGRERDPNTFRRLHCEMALELQVAY